jgi:metal transporter CNNM
MSESNSENPPNIPLLISLDVLLLMGAALFAGLTLSVMGLDTLSLEIIATSGQEPDRTHANKLLPVRRMGNRLLCTLIFGNVMVNTLIAQITDRFVTGMAGTALSTALITLGGEIIPQASMAAHALQVGAASVPICRLFLFLFYPVCGPLAYLLDRFVGTDPGQIYDRNELRKLMAVHASSHFSAASGLGEQDLNVMLGAMDLHDKTVSEAMTPLGEVYMIDAHEILTDQLIHEIWESGHSRIPVYRGNRGNIIGLLFAKDLLLSRTDERTAVLDLIRFYPRTALSVMADTKLIVVLQEFRTGRSHLATVKQVTVVGGGDPHYETVGIVTMEDVVEELIRANIEDEFDVRDNDPSSVNSTNASSPNNALAMTPSKAFQMKRALIAGGGAAGAGGAAGPLEQKWTGLPKECIRAMRKTTLEESHARVASLFLVESVTPFRGHDPSVVRTLFAHRDHVFRIKAPLRARQLPWESKSNLWLFRKGVPTNFMVLVIAGSVEIFMEDPTSAVESFTNNSSITGTDFKTKENNSNNNNRNPGDDDFVDEEEMLDFGKGSSHHHTNRHGIVGNSLLPSSSLPVMEMSQWTVLGSSAIGHPKGVVIPDFSARVVSNAVLLLINSTQFKDAFSGDLGATTSSTTGGEQHHHTSSARHHVIPASPALHSTNPKLFTTATTKTLPPMNDNNTNNNNTSRETSPAKR